MLKKKIEIFLEENEIQVIAKELELMKSNGFNTSRSEWIRVAVVEKIGSLESRRLPRK